MRRSRFLVAALALVLVGCDATAGSAGSRAAGAATGIPAAPGSSAPAAPGSSAPAAPGSSAPGSPSPAATAPPVTAPPPTAPTAPALVDVAIVPVVDFRSAESAVGAADVHAALSGGGRYSALELVTDEADAILAALGSSRPADPTRLVLAPDAKTLARDLAAHRDRLGFVRAAQVTAAVRALAWDGRSLFGVERVSRIADWPLVAPLTADASPLDPDATWTLAAGGDILLDRGVARQVKVLGKGVDFPFDGGTAEITGRRCCSSFGWELPRTRRTGNAGAVRDLVERADLAAANFENPAPDRFRYHVHGTTFSADPRLIDGLRKAGIDWVSLANNHIRDAGATGVLQTMANLDERGIAHSGAGRNLTEARRPALLDAGGVKVAFLGYDTIAPTYAAGTDRVGSARMSESVVRHDVAAARKAGADVVVVYPHWGVEYTAKATSLQRRLGRAAIDAGADLVIGNHPHWVGAMEIYRGKPIWYALGNFVFDQTWSEPTLEGLVLELTFHDRTLVQAWLHPTIILDQSQPNLLDPGGDGTIVLDRLYRASGKMLPW